MIQLIALLNVLLLFIGVAVTIKKLANFGSGALTLLTAAVFLLILLSFLYYLMLLTKQSFAVLLVILSVINAANLYINKKEIPGVCKSVSFNGNSIWALIAVLFFTIYLVLVASKYGGWDAMAIWNLHAKFLYHLESWQRLFSNDIAFSHPDYPLMLPGLVAFFWKSINNISPMVPYLLTYGIMILVPLVLYYALLQEGLTLFACLALAIFVADTNYKLFASSQEADILLSSLILLTFIHANSIKRSAENAYLLGFICASCASAKNEGIAFYLIFSLFFLLINIRAIPILKRYFWGALLPTIILLSFKLLLSPANDLVAANHGHMQSIPAKLMDPHRYITIFQFMMDEIADHHMFAIILVIVVSVYNRRFLISFPFIIIVALFTVYFAVYLLTPYDLKWHLSTSVDRLFLQIYPSLVYLSFLALGEIKQKIGLSTIVNAF